MSRCKEHKNSDLNNCKEHTPNYEGDYACCVFCELDASELENLELRETLRQEGIIC